MKDFQNMINGKRNNGAIEEIRKLQEEIEKLKNIKLKAEEAVAFARDAVKCNGDAVEAVEAKARFVAKIFLFFIKFLSFECYLLAITEVKAIGTPDMMSYFSAKV